MSGPSGILGKKVYDQFTPKIASIGTPLSGTTPNPRYLPEAEGEGGNKGAARGWDWGN